MSLAGRTVLATGAGCGIGAAIERVFAERGASVAVNDVDQAAAERTVGEIAASSFVTGATLDVNGGLLMREIVGVAVVSGRSALPSSTRPWPA